MLFLLAVAEAVLASKCVSIKSTSVCAPWSGEDLYIDSEKLATVYGADIPDANTWEKMLLESTSGGEKQAELWRKWGSCDKYEGEHIQYYRSYACLTDIFGYSSHCNKNAKGLVPVCPEVCTNYASAANQLVQESCSGMSHKNKALLHNASESCKSLASGSFFDSKKQCVTGVKTDEASCGFGGDASVSAAYCKQNADATCCTTSGNTVGNDTEKIDYGRAQSLAADSSAGASNGDSGSLNGIITAVVAGVAFIAFAGISFFVFSRRNARNEKVNDTEKDVMFGSKTDVDVYLAIDDASPTTADPDLLRIYNGDEILVYRDTITDDMWAQARHASDASGKIGTVCLRILQKKVGSNSE